MAMWNGGNSEDLRLPPPKYLGRGRFHVGSLEEEMEVFARIRSESSDSAMAVTPRSWGRARILGRLAAKRNDEDPPLGLQRNNEETEKRTNPTLPASSVKTFESPQLARANSNNSRPQEVVVKERGEGTIRKWWNPKRREYETDKIVLLPGMGMQKVERVYDEMMRRHLDVESDEKWED